MSCQEGDFWCAAEPQLACHQKGREQVATQADKEADHTGLTFDKRCQQRWSGSQGHRRATSCAGQVRTCRLPQRK